MTKALFKNAWGYQGDATNLPVANVDVAIPFYEQAMGFRVLSRNEFPQRSAMLERADIRIGLTENGGDPTQDGCAFEVDNIEALHEELMASGLRSNSGDADDSDSRSGTISSDIKIEKRDDGSSWRVFFVVAPDGLCYWFGERQ